MQKAILAIAILLITSCPLALTLTTAAAQAGEIPKRKPGLWELRFYSNDVKPSQAAALVPDSAKMCIGDTTDDKLAAAYDPCDVPLFFGFYAPQFTNELVCETAAPDVKATSRSKVTFTGDTAYHIEVKSRLEALKSVGEYSGGRDGKWVGACPADMRPGDLIVGDEPKINVLEELAKPDR